LVAALKKFHRLFPSPFKSGHNVIYKTGGK